MTSQNDTVSAAEPGSGFALNAVEPLALSRLTLDWPQPERPLRSDFDLNPDWTGRQDFMHFRPAAVLIPLVDRGSEDEVSVVLTRRTDHLPTHAGQVALPGGKIDADDKSALDAALREAEEEIGLSRRLVRPFGYLDPYFTSTGFRIHPVVASVPAEAPLVPREAEVAEIFEVPLRFLMDPANHQIGSRVWKGGERRFYAMPYGRHYVWGVTAGILRLLYERLYAS